MQIKNLLLLFFVCVLLFGKTAFCFAFGISPPRVFNDRLVPGARFEQIITLTQGNPENSLDIKVLVDAPEVESWLSFEPGKEFTIPAGVQQFPMKVIVSVPIDTGYDEYEGKFTVRAMGSGGTGQVSILTGAVAHIKLNVTGDEYSDFKLRGIKILTIEEGEPIQISVKLENLGNVKVRPARVELRIFDKYKDELLESGEAIFTNWVNSFETDTLIGEMITTLGVGEYWVEFDVYKGEYLILQDKASFHILAKGEKGKILGFTLWTWLMIGGAILAFIIFIFLIKKLFSKLGFSVKVQRKK